MSTAETTVSPGFLSFGTTFGAGFSAVFGRFWLYFKAALLPVALAILLGVLGFATLFIAPVLSLPLNLLGMVPFALLGVACCRLALIGRDAGALPRPLFGRRTWVYFGYSLLFILLVSIPMLVAMFGFIGSALITLGIDPEAVDPEAYTNIGFAMLTVFPFYLIYMYFITRLSLVFPAVAVDQKLGLGGSWRLTRGGAGFKLYAVFVVMTIVFTIAISVIIALVSSAASLFWLTPGGLPRGPVQVDTLSLMILQAPVLIVTLVLEYLAFAIVIASLASAYAQLSGWGAPRQEILERFE